MPSPLLTLDPYIHNFFLGKLDNNANTALVTYKYSNLDTFLRQNFSDIGV